MQLLVTNIYLGLPDDLKAICFWVEREFRINDLSFQNGGSDIVIQYSSGAVFGYDRVKYPSRYIYRILLNKAKEVFSEKELKENNRLLPSLIQKVFVRKYNNGNSNNISFKEVWNKSSLHLPWENLEGFTSDTYLAFLKYFKNNLLIIKKYLSLWYPFPYYEILTNWEQLEKGEAHYSVFLSDTDTIYTPEFGLCFNENIRWNSKLRSKWEYGFDNMFYGYVEGIGNSHVEFDEKDYLDHIIPLSINKELIIRNECILNHWS